MNLLKEILDLIFIIFRFFRSSQSEEKEKNIYDKIKEKDKSLYRSHVLIIVYEFLYGICFLFVFLSFISFRMDILFNTSFWHYILSFVEIWIVFFPFIWIARVNNDKKIKKKLEEEEHDNIKK